jgi:monoamine oxidase
MKEKRKKLNRRTVLKMTGLGLGSMLISHCSTSKKKAEEDEIEVISNSHQTFKRVPTTEDDGPIDRTFGEIAPFRFSGDEPDHSHQILWDIPRFISTIGGNVPAPTEKAAVVVVGGGMSGMFAGYQLKKYIPIVLERADRFGGNSRGEAWRGIDYSIGAASFAAPIEGSPLDQLYKELDLYRRLKAAPTDKSALLKGQLFQKFFKGESDPALASQWATLEKYFTETLENKNGRVFPEFPPVTEAQMATVKELDKLSLRDQIKKVLGTESIHAQLETWLEHFSWSTFGASYREVSAAVGVNQLASEFGRNLVAPGGNAFVAEQLLKKLRKAVGSDRVRSRCVVFQVKIVGDEVWVSYERDGQVKTIAAESVVLACPKFVVRKIFTDLEPEREKIIRRIRYNSYLVANIMLNQKVSSQIYEVNNLGDGKINGKDIQGSSDEDRVTSVINGTFAVTDAKNGILTLYRPFPYLVGLANIYSGGAYLKYRKEMIEQIEKEILPALGIPATAVTGVRLARWGHSLPVSQPGLIRSGATEVLHKPHQDKIYFVNQDNWLNPCLEMAFAEAQKWGPILVKALEDRRLAKMKQSNSSPQAPRANPSPAKAPGSSSTESK